VRDALAEPSLRTEHTLNDDDARERPRLVYHVDRNTTLRHGIVAVDGPPVRCQPLVVRLSTVIARGGTTEVT
jgi:hypothetical protein